MLVIVSLFPTKHHLVLVIVEKCALVSPKPSCPDLDVTFMHQTLVYAIHRNTRCFLSSSIDEMEFSGSFSRLTIRFNKESLVLKSSTETALEIGKYAIM